MFCVSAAEFASPTKDNAIITPTLAKPVLSNKVVITVESDIYDYAQQIIKGQPILEVTDYSGANSQRDVVEFILVQQALKLGGLDLHFIFEKGNYDARNLKLLQTGYLLLSFDSIWLSAAQTIADDVYISAPVIEKGEYYAGIYSNLANQPLIDIKRAEDFARYSVISSQDWHVDWITLSALKPKQLIHEADWIAMAKMVQRGWADVMLAPFTKQPPFIIQGQGYKLQALEGVRVALQDSRHFVVSRKHPLGEQTIRALEKGLAILKQQGRISRAYHQSGFLNPLVEQWPVIAPSTALSEMPKH